MDLRRMCLLLVWLSVSGCAAFGSDESAEDFRTLRVVSFNIRYANPGDGLHHWGLRRDRVSQLVTFHGADVVGVQEALYGQLVDLDADWGDFDRVGVGRDDGQESGEFCAIYYRRDRLQPVDSGTFWLSSTPKVPSASWATLNRICTWAWFEDRRTGIRFLVLNTHWDHQSSEARLESARLIKERVESLTRSSRGLSATKVPVVLLGDFNCEADEAPTLWLGQGEYALFDARAVTETPPYGPNGTFTGFSVPPEVEKPAPRIDFIWVRGSLRVRRYAVLPHFWDGRLASDHRPVWAEIAY